MPCVWWHGLVAFLAIAPQAIARPFTSNGGGARRSFPLYKRADHDISGCDSDQRAQIEGALEDLSGLVTVAYKSLHYEWRANKGYTHYFSEDDHDGVVKAFRAALNAAIVPDDGLKYNIRCGAEQEEQCSTESLASADPTPEDFDGGPHEKGPRTVTLCPAFFRDNQTRRRLPGDDEAKKAEFCKDRQSKTLSDFQTGAHTLLLEISRLDTFGVAAEYPEAAQAATNDVPEHTHHGAVDWRGKADAGNARALKTSKDQGKPATWQNAGSLAAAATEMYAMAACGLKDIDVSTGQQSAALKFGPTCDSLLWGFSILLFWLCGS